MRNQGLFAVAYRMCMGSRLFNDHLVARTTFSANSATCFTDISHANSRKPIVYPTTVV